MRGWATALLVLTGCSSDPVPPTVSIVSQAPDGLVPGSDDEDDVSLRLAYEDGDGDLGGGIMYVHDCRDAEGEVRLPIPVVAAEEIVEDMQPISGELIALVPDIDAAPADATPAPLCAEQGVTLTADSLVLCVVLEDSAGGRSGVACSDPFALSGP
jgi:hypothetical protein